MTRDFLDTPNSIGRRVMHQTPHANFTPPNQAFFIPRIPFIGIKKAWFGGKFV
jgi:hypothetical protein